MASVAQRASMGTPSKQRKQGRPLLAGFLRGQRQHDARGFGHRSRSVHDVERLLQDASTPVGDPKI